MSSKNLGGPQFVTAAVLYVVVVAISLSLLPHSATAGVKCPEVVLKVAPCLLYIREGGEPSMSCCEGVISLKSEFGKSKSDLRAACKCLKNMATNITPKEADNAKDLPDLCHVHIPYPISLKTDCDKIK